MPKSNRDLVQHLGVRLVVRDAAPLAVVEEPEVHRQDLSTRRDA
jgi:hypothetical protein